MSRPPNHLVPVARRAMSTVMACLVVMALGMAVGALGDCRRHWRESSERDGGGDECLEGTHGISLGGRTYVPSVRALHWTDDLWRIFAKDGQNWTRAYHSNK
jgi:hypothetical protein